MHGGMGLQPGAAAYQLQQHHSLLTSLETGTLTEAIGSMLLHRPRATCACKTENRHIGTPLALEGEWALARSRRRLVTQLPSGVLRADRNLPPGPDERCEAPSLPAGSITNPPSSHVAPSREYTLGMRSIYTRIHRNGYGCTL